MSGEHGNTQGKKDKKQEISGEQVRTTKYGDISMDDDVIASIVALVVSGTPGVAAMVGGMTDGITEMLGKKSATKGVKVETTDGATRVGVAITVDYGIPIPDLAYTIQKEAAEQVKNMTGVRLHGVDVHVQGVQFNDNHSDTDEGKAGKE